MEVFETLFEKPVHCAEVWGECTEVLHPEELAFLKGANKSRKEEFIAVRACANKSLAYLGIKRPVLIADSIRGLNWPRGIVGSLTHTGQYRAALIASKTYYISLGIDAEKAVPLPVGIEDRILTQNEKKQLNKLEEAQDFNICNMIYFSAKESVYKTWGPLHAQFLDFRQVELSIEPLSGNRGRFIVAIDRPSPTMIRGAWLISEGLVRTGAWVESH